VVSSGPVRAQQPPGLDGAGAPERAQVDDRAPLVDRLASVIQSRVLSGALARGARLPQKALAAEFGVSRTPIREALRTLQATGLVELVPNRGAVVRGPTARDIREAYVVRAELEGLAAELAADRISDRDLLRLREAEKLFRRSVTSLLARRRRGQTEPRWEDGSTWVRANDLFHQAIFDAAANARLSAAIADLHRSFPRDLTWSALAGNSRLLEENVEQHAVILQAIERRDAGEARRLMVEHVRRAGELVSLHFERASAAAAG
jgi:DNA-binding GntR family transcriptional regulator